MNQSELMARAASRCQEHQWCLGNLLGAYCRAEQKSLDVLATELGCSADTLNLMFLCRRPPNDDLRGYASVLAEHFDSAFDQERLVAILVRCT